jgi:hypothetical protein
MRAQRFMIVVAGLPLRALAQTKTGEPLQEPLLIIALLVVVFMLLFGIATLVIFRRYYQRASADDTVELLIQKN